MNKERYLQTVMNGLNCSKRDKKRIYEDLSSDIDMAMENGESWQSIYQRLGSPETMISDLMENMEIVPKKSHKKLIIGIIAGIISLCIIGFIAFNMLVPKTIPLEESKIYDIQKVKERSYEVIQYAGNKEYEKFIALGDENMKKVFTKEEFEKAMNTFELGDFDKFEYEGYIELTNGDGKFAGAEIKAKYENNAIIYALTFNEEMELIGFFLK